MTGATATGLSLSWLPIWMVTWTVAGSSVMFSTCRPLALDRHQRNFFVTSRPEASMGTEASASTIRDEPSEAPVASDGGDV